MNPGNFAAVFVGTEWTQGDFKTCAFGIKISFHVCRGKEPRKLPTGIAKNNYCRMESIVNSPVR